MKNTINYIKEHKEQFLNELISLLKIPSVSADSSHKNDVLHAAEFLQKHFEQIGMDVAKVYPTKGHPIVYAEKIIDKQLPTVLVYGHYDVQPADPLNLWDTPPFEPTVKKTQIHPEGALFGRGTCDDKGQMFMHVKAVDAMLKAGELPCNVKFMIEGEEEVGSESLGHFIVEYKEMLAADVILISDTGMIANDTPSITTGLRGLCYMEVEVTGPNRDLHSGLYGGCVTNPINALSKMISSLQDENGHITIDGFYDHVVNLSDEEREMMNRAPHNEEKYKKSIGITAVNGEKGYTTIERGSIRPTLDVNGIWGGYTGEGSKTIIPSKAYAKISMRLVPNQTPKEIAEKFEQYFKSISEPGTTVKVVDLHGGLPVVTEITSKAYKAAEKAYETTFGKTPIPVRSGGSIPIVALFESVLGLKSIMMGFGLDSDAIHSPNEHYGLFNFYRGIETIPYFYKNFAEK